MTRRIEITEEILKDGVNEYVKGDILTLDVGKANQWIACGWAKDVETGEQGERKPGASKLDIQNIKQIDSAIIK